MSDFHFSCRFKKVIYVGVFVLNQCALYFLELGRLWYVIPFPDFRPYESPGHSELHGHILQKTVLGDS